MAKGNHQATGKKAGHGPEIVQYVRRVMLGAFEIVDAKGLKITELLAKELEANPMKFLEVVSKYCPREVAMEVESHVYQHATEISRDELLRIAAGSGEGVAEEGRRSQKPADVH